MAYNVNLTNSHYSSSLLAGCFSFQAAALLAFKLMVDFVILAY